VAGIAAAVATLTLGGVALALSRTDGGSATAALSRSNATTVGSSAAPRVSVAVAVGGGSPGGAGGAGTSAAPTSSTAASAPVTVPSAPAGTAPPFTMAPPVTLVAPTSPPASSPAPTAAPTPAPASTAPAPSGPVALTAAQANAALLTIDEVASDTGQTPWAAGTFVPAGDLCGIPSPDPIVQRHAVADHKGISDVAEVTSTVVVYETVENATAASDSLRQATTSCPDPHQSADGVTADLSFTSAVDATLPGIDQTFVFGMVARVNGTPVVQSLNAVMRLGRTGAVVQYTVAGRDIGQDDYARVQALFARQALKLIQAAR
jgi:hypothetical protein